VVQHARIMIGHRLILLFVGVGDRHSGEISRLCEIGNSYIFT
jgi:hypothetical protein